MSHDPSNSNEHLPAWLHGVPLPPRPSDAGEAAAPSQASWPGAEPDLTTQAGTPGWLTDAGEGDSAAGDVPDWLRESAADPGSSMSASSDVPDWLRDLGEPEVPPMPQSTAGAVPDWLQSTSSEAPAAPAGDQAEAVPDWLRDLGEPAAPSMPPPAADDAPEWLQPESEHADSAAESQHVPDWLRADLNDAASQPPVEQSTEEDLPDWLRADLETGAQSGGEPVADMPNWLHDLEAHADDSSSLSGQPPAEDAHSAQFGAAAEHTPDWLHDPDATDMAAPPSEAAPEWTHATEASSETAAQSDAPSWLQADDHPSQTPSSAEPAAADEDDSGVPDWLNQAPLDEVREIMAGDQEISPDVAPFSFEGASEGESTSAPSDAPAWLQAPSDEENSTSSWFDAPPAQTPVPEQPAASADVPAWLQNIDTTQGAEAEPFESLAPEAMAQYDIPEWMQDTERTAEGSEAGEMPAWLQAEERQEAAADEASAWLPEETQPPAQPAGDVPAWLQAEDREEHGALPTSDMPDWLQGAGIESPSSAPASDVPDWLQSAEPAAMAADQEAAPVPGDVPDWLQGAGIESPSSAAASDVPEWLQSAEPAAMAVDQEAAPAPGDVPDWLRDTGVGSGDVTPPSMTPPDDTSHDVPDWLQAEHVDVPDMSHEAAPGEDVPEWLRAEPADGDQQRGDVPPWLRDESGTPLPASGMPGEAHLPAWLHDAPVDVPPPSEAEPVAPVQDASDASTWFNDIGAEPIEEPAADEPESEFFGGAELPTWLRSPEAQREQRSEADQRDAHALDWLSRIGGVEEEAPAITPEEPGPRLAPPAVPVRSQAHLQAVALLERLATAPEVALGAAPETAPARRRTGAARLLYLALLLVLVAGLLVPALSVSLQVPPVVPSAQPLFNVLDNLNENDVVLVGYEWNARRISELRPLEQAVMGQLLAKKVKLVIVSTDPQGTLVAFNLRNALAQAGYESRGLDYLWLGYKPGGEVALRSLAQDIPGALRSDFYGDDANISPLAQGFRTNTPLTSLDAFSAVVVLADEPLDVQGWMEQIHRSVPQKPIAFLLPAETAPITQPYMRQPNVYYLAGKSGALAYEELRGASAASGDIEVQYAQQRLGLLVFAALLLVGIVIGGASAAARRGRNAS